MRTKLLLALALSVLSLASCGSSASLDPALEARLKTIAQSYQDEFGIPGMLVGVWIPGEGEMIFESGVSEVDTDEPIRRSDHYRIGSVTKSFTVTIILQLAEAGLLSLDDTVGQYLPGVQNSGATLAQLANMRSGIFNYTQDMNFVLQFIEDFQRVWSEQELVDFANSNNPYFLPDAGWHYSNTNTVILGMIVQQVTGRPMSEEIRTRILAPLGMDGTLYPTTPELPSPFSHGYGFDPLEDLTLVDPSGSAGSGAMISTLLDMKTWAEALGTGRLLLAATQAERMNSLQPIVFDPCDDNDPNRAKVACPEYDRYGYGFGEIDGWIGHTGEYIGFLNLTMYRPTDGAVVVIMVNRSMLGDHVPTSMFEEIAAEL